MTLWLFDHDARRCFKGTRSKTHGPHAHEFGGTANQLGLTFCDTEHPFHLLFALKTDDPFVASVVPTHSEQILPFFFGYSYASEVDQFVYRHHGTEIEVRTPTQLKYTPNFPSDELPRSFARHFVQLEEVSIDLATARDALSFAAVFGFDGLSEAEFRTAVDIAKKETHIFELWADMEDWSDRLTMEFGYVEPFWQRKPSGDCKSRSMCGGDTLRVIAIFDPNDDTTYREFQVVLQHCPKCGCFTTSYQCT